MQRTGATERLLIEALDHEHAEGLVAALDHPGVGRYIGGPDVSTVEALHGRIDRIAVGPDSPDQAWINHVVRRASDGVIVGRLEATVYDGWAEVAYVFGPAHWGNGYATEGLQWLVAELFADGAHDLWAAVHHENQASRRLVERVGFVETTDTTRVPASYDPGDIVYRLDAPIT